MALAFKESFSAGMTGVVIIGTDCPDLKAQLMVKAFYALEQNDLVLGPALDGGYYLIGLRRLIPELFTGISWSTAEVLEQTIRIAQRLDLAIAFLPLLNDIDRPEDLIGQTVDGYQVEG
jgi:rSAM/selenodomain-associated transferase 1